MHRLARRLTHLFYLHPLLLLKVVVCCCCRTILASSLSHFLARLDDDVHSTVAKPPFVYLDGRFSVFGYCSLVRAFSREEIHTYLPFPAPLSPSKLGSSKPGASCPLYEYDKNHWSYTLFAPEDQGSPLDATATEETVRNLAALMAIRTKCCLPQLLSVT